MKLDRGFSHDEDEELQQWLIADPSRWDNNLEMAELWGRNINDVEELTKYTTFTRVGVYVEPRLFGLDVSYKF